MSERCPKTTRPWSRVGNINDSSLLGAYVDGAGLNGVQKVAGSNPAAPTKQKLIDSSEFPRGIHSLLHGLVVASGQNLVKVSGKKVSRELARRKWSGVFVVIPVTPLGVTLLSDGRLAVPKLAGDVLQRNPV